MYHLSFKSDNYLKVYEGTFQEKCGATQKNILCHTRWTALLYSDRVKHLYNINF